MADTKALFTNRFDAARTAWTEGEEPAAAECLRSAVFAARSDPNLRRELALALYHLGRLSRKFGPAGETEAEPLLSEALAISEELFGSKDAALSPLLQELSRLYVQRAQNARAEDVLERLVAIARVKGEEHPDVAVALSDLAFVKRKLGDDASAEALYRNALRIREKTLEPNHTLTIGTLERLSETCAARGDFAEALALLRRALPTREAALGPGHERVRAARSRVAEFELQLANAAQAATVAPSPINSKELEFLGESDPRVLRPSTRPRERSKTPTVAAAVAASLIASSIPTPSASQIVIAEPKSASSSGKGIGESGAAHRDLILADVANASISHAGVASIDIPLGDLRSISRDPRKKRTRLYASAGVGAVAIALAGLLLLRPRAASGRGPVSTEASAVQGATAGDPVVTSPVTKSVSVATRAAAIVGATRADSLRAATLAPTAGVIQREQDAPKSAAPVLRAPRVEVRLDSSNMPTIPVAPSGDAILRSAIERQRASDTDRAEARAAVSPPTSADVANAHTSPRVIGRAPDPGFPDALLRSGQREGQVVVRFIVTELGRVDVSSMIVERSDHELFTAAVRDVLPLFRFEPAHTLGSDSKPVAVWVSVPFRFTTKKR